MDFITIDFETATTNRNSPCAIGLTFVKNNKIIDTKTWLIKPQCYPNFDKFNISVHGIKPQNVSDMPEFDQLWKAELKNMLKNQLVIAHYASFDFSVLRNTLDMYQIPYPNIHYLCSYIFSKKVWPKLLSYNLMSLCNLNKIQLKHHDTGSDALACAKLSLKAFDLFNVKNTNDITTKLGITIGKLFNGGYKPSETKRIYHYKYRKPILIVGNVSKHKSDNMFYEKHVVFTGTLSSMTRAKAQQIIADIGGINSDLVSKETDFLIIGQQDFKRVGDNGMSTNRVSTSFQLVAQVVKNFGSSMPSVCDRWLCKSL
ncbi:MAG: exonuclease domain-containing protein [Candidatus Aenigmatarchaeota archaeon]